MNTDIFPILILTGRPASGKSEILDFLTRLPEEVRRRQYHVGTLEILDDFPLLWAWFETDEILRDRLNKPRLYTDDRGILLHRYLWDVLIERLSLAYQKRLRDVPDLHEHTTVFFEFSRGKEHDGYRQALPHLSDEILQKASLIYVRVPFSESRRKNRLRFNPERPDSILEHGLPDWKLERLYLEDDWDSLTANDPDFIPIRSQSVPYQTFENEDDVTSGSPNLLARRLQEVLDRLWITRLGK